MKKIAMVVVLIAVVASAAALLLQRSGPKRPHVVMLMLDTLRADHLSSYGYERVTSPNIDAFGSDATRYLYAVTAAPWTPTSVATMFTGFYPALHGMVPPNNREKAKKNDTKLGAAFHTMAEILAGNGYATYAISPNPWITKTFGFDQGFDSFVFQNRARADKITDTAIAAIDTLKAATKPFFLYVHYLDPHDPYDPPGEYATKFTGSVASRNLDPTMVDIVNRYDGEIAFMDHHLGRLFQKLKDDGLYDDALIILVGDHGEQFMEHGHRGHGYKVHNEEVHVPLIIRSGAQPREVDFTVSTVDLLPTVLDRAGIAAPKGLHGLSLLNDENTRGRDGVLTEVRRILHQRAYTRYDGKKVIVDLGSATREVEAVQKFTVFDGRRDTLEQQPLTDTGLLQSLRKSLEELYDSVAPGALTKESSPAEPGADEVPDETLEQLKSMGYLQ